MGEGPPLGTITLFFRPAEAHSGQRVKANFPNLALLTSDTEVEMTELLLASSIFRCVLLKSLASFSKNMFNEILLPRK